MYMGDWRTWGRSGLHPDVHRRVQAWLQSLLKYAQELPVHLEHLRSAVAS